MFYPEFVEDAAIAPESAGGSMWATLSTVSGTTEGLAVGKLPRRGQSETAAVILPTGLRLSL